MPSRAKPARASTCRRRPPRYGQPAGNRSDLSDGYQPPHGGARRISLLLTTAAMAARTRGFSLRGGPFAPILPAVIGSGAVFCPSGRRGRWSPEIVRCNSCPAPSFANDPSHPDGYELDECNQSRRTSDEQVLGDDDATEKTLDAGERRYRCPAHAGGTAGRRPGPKRAGPGG